MSANVLSPSPEVEAALDGWRARGMPFQARPRLVRVLPSSARNQCYLIEADSRQLVLRLRTGAAELPGVDREREARMQAAAAQVGLAPALIHADAARGLLVSEYRVGQQRARGTLDERESDALLDALRQVHALAPTGPPLDYLAHYRAYARQSGRAECLSRDMQRSLVRIADGSPAGVCHHDPVPGNVIFVAGRALLIDWEYAAVGATVFDFASVVVDWEVPASRVAERAAISQDLLEDACALYVALCSWWSAVV